MTTTRPAAELLREVNNENETLRARIADLEKLATIKPKGPAFSATIGLMQAVIFLIFHLTKGAPEEMVVLSYATLIVTNGWGLGELLVKGLKKGRVGLLLAVSAANVAGFGGLQGCASFPASQGTRAEVRAVEDGDQCRILVEVDGQVRDDIEVSDCASLKLPRCIEPPQ